MSALPRPGVALGLAGRAKRSPNADQPDMIMPSVRGALAGTGAGAGVVGVGVGGGG